MHRVAITLAAADLVDRLIAELPDDLVAECQALGLPRMLDRSLHRREHLDEIVARLGRWRTS